MEEEKKRQEEKKEAEKKTRKEEKPPEKMTVKELREIALTLPHSGAVHDMKKEELIAFIKEAKGIPAEKPRSHEPKVKKVPLNKAELKARIVELRKEKTEALNGKDRKRVGRLRRTISRLKKKTRRAAA